MKQAPTINQDPADKLKATDKSRPAEYKNVWN
jgi:hypothetical protein